MTESPVSAPPVPQRELGFTDDQSAGDWWGDLTQERIPELRFPDAYDVYDEMMDNAQVYSVVRATMLPQLRTPWRLDGTGCRDDIVQACSDDLGLPIVGDSSSVPSEEIEGRFDWGEHLELALEEKYSYGHSVFEQNATWSEDLGRWRLHKLAYRAPRTIKKFNVARDGGLVSVEQSGAPFGVMTTLESAKPKVLPVGRLVVYTNRRKGARWRGRSMLRPIYMPWLLNNRAARVEMITAERQGSPLVVYVGAEGESSADVAKGRRLAQAVRAGSTAGAGIPHGAQLDQKGIEGQLPDIDKIKRYNNEQIARVALAHFLNLGSQTGQTGSYALGATFEDFFTLTIQAEADALARLGSRHIVHDLVQWNWPGERAPKLVHDEIGARRDHVVAAVADLVTNGVLQPDEPLEHFIRTTLGLPPRGRPTPTPTED